MPPPSGERDLIGRTTVETSPAQGPPTGSAAIFRSRRSRDCGERALVLRARGIPHAVRRGAEGWVLLVPAPIAEQARRELADYERENENWPRRRARLPIHPAGVGGAIAYAAILLIAYVLQRDGAFGFDWFGAGRVQASLVRGGEWHRTVTALTLHLDGAHILGNVVIGALFGVIAAHLFGNGLAWFAILLSGAVGNALSAMLQAPDHAAVGASTAVFAALGLTAGYVWRRRLDQRGRWALRIAPIVAAAVLFAMMGSGGPRTDVIAHLTGFASGIAFGAAFGGSTWSAPGPRGQRILGAAALAMLVIAWTIALPLHG